MVINEQKAIEIGKRVIEKEIDALKCLVNNIDDTFIQIIKLLEQCKGKVIITGMGKSGHVARKIAATMASLGISSFFLHPGEAMHGDLGMIQKDDVVIAISYSGESDEIIRIIPNIKIIGAKLIGITGNSNSTLAQKSDIAECFGDIREACHLGLAPTTSTTVVMAFGDALAIALSELRNFNKKDFALFHPAGSLGKKLTIKATDIMIRMSSENCVLEDDYLEKAIKKMGTVKSNIIPVVDEVGRMIGIVTNGAIERSLDNKNNIYDTKITSMINKFPVYVEADTMAIDALKILMKSNIKAMPVVREESVVGIINRDDILKSGIYL